MRKFDNDTAMMERFDLNHSRKKRLGDSKAQRSSSNSTAMAEQAGGGRDW